MNWAVVIALSLGPAISNGLARFAYGLVLPSMQNELIWSHTQAGLLNTANAVGYLLGAVLTFWVIVKTGPRKVFILGVCLTPLTLLGVALVSDLWALSFFRVMAGVTGAGIFISGGAMAAMLFQNEPPKNALAISIYFGGGGLGIFLSGITIPLLLAKYGDQAWPLAWLVLSVMCAIGVWPTIWAATRCDEPKRHTKTKSANLPLVELAFSISAYFCFSVGYIIYLTYLAAVMRTQGATQHLVAITWSIMGIAVMLAPYLWRTIIEKSKACGALALACFATSFATLLPILAQTSTATLLTSAVLFGLSFFIAPAAITSFSRKNLDQSQWSKSVAMFTIVFAAGQTVGPAMAGWIADATGSVQKGIEAAGGALLIAAILSLAQRRIR